MVLNTKSSSALFKRSRRDVYNGDCGTHSAASGLILNGTKSVKGFWPWKVALFQKDSKTTKFFCGGVIISRTFVITAAHCLYGKSAVIRKLDSEIMVIIGAHYLHKDREPGALSKVVVKSYIHEDWNIQTENYDADIALLEIDVPITYSNFINRICLWYGDDSLNEAEGIIVGWGVNNSTQIDRHSNGPLQMVVPVIDSKKCWLDHHPLLKLSSNRTICGGPRDGIQSPCVGDSGSGLYVKSKNKTTDVFFLRGLVSSTLNDEKKNCNTRTYAVYTDIFMFTDWIKRTAELAATVSRCFLDKFHVHYGYSCKFSANIKSETDVLSLNHVEGKTDNDVIFLNLDNSTFKALPTNVFQNFHQLKHLKMWNVSLKKIQETSFTSCPNLTVLGLRFNELTKLPNGAFKDLNQLIGLGLNNNPITEIETDAFIGLVKLQYLYLHSNKVTEISDKTFEPLIGLKMLHLNQTLIRTIHEDAFKSTTRLWFLNLEEGLLTSIGALIFEPLKNLRYLLLNNNNIDFIHEDAFKSLIKLKVLSLRENKIRKLSASTFLYQKKLERLSFKNNTIEIIENGTLDKLISLTNLDALGNVCVDEIFEKSFDYGAIESNCTKSVKT